MHDATTNHLSTTLRNTSERIHSLIASNETVLALEQIDHARHTLERLHDHVEARRQSHLAQLLREPQG